MQAKRVRTAWREDGWGLDVVEQRTEKNEVLGEAACGRIVTIRDSGAGGLDAGKLGSSLSRIQAQSNNNKPVTVRSSQGRY